MKLPPNALSLLDDLIDMLKWAKSECEEAIMLRANDESAIPALEAIHETTLYTSTFGFEWCRVSPSENHLRINMQNGKKVMGFSPKTGINDVGPYIVVEVPHVLGECLQMLSVPSNPKNLLTHITEMQELLDSVVPDLKRLRRELAIDIGLSHDGSTEKDVSGTTADDKPATAPEEGVHGKPNMFLCEGDNWRLRFAGKKVRGRGLKGHEYIRLLLEHPRREFGVLDLVYALESKSADSLQDTKGAIAGEMSNVPEAGEKYSLTDDKYRAAVELRMEHLESELAGAAWSDPEKTLELKDELAKLRKLTSEATGLSGRSRSFPIDSEKARSRVQRSIERARNRIFDIHPALGRHLKNSIKTGFIVVYSPAEDIEWITR